MKQVASESLRVMHVVASDQVRGAELFAADLVRALDAAGVEQRVVILRRSSGRSVRFEAPVTVLGQGGPRIPGLRLRQGGLANLRHMIKAWRPIILQAHGGETLKYCALAAAGQGSEIVYRRIGAAPPWIRGGPRRVAYAAFLRRAARVVAVSEAVRRETVELFRGRNLVTIPNAVDARRMRSHRERDATRRALGVAPSARVILSVGALTWEKDPMTHVEVGSRVLSDLPDAVHLIAGEGPMRADVESAVRGHGLQGRVLLLGSRDDVPDLLVASDLLLFASRPDGMEGMPATVIEAGMMGVPVVGYGIVGVPEVVHNGVTGILTKYGDKESLAEQVVALLRDDRRREKLGAAARERCRTQFDIAAIAARYLRLYEELVEAA